MADHYARTFTAAGATTLTLDGMPYGAGRMIVSKVGGDNGDLWLSVGNAVAAVGANNCVVIPDGKSDEMVWINGLLQRTQHLATYPDWSFTVDYTGQIHVEVLDVCGLEPDLPVFLNLQFILTSLQFLPDLQFA